MSANLFEPYQLNETITLQNKIVMAPLTRSFADEDLVPTPAMGDYYARRGDLGLIITEATSISKVAQGYPNIPGVYSKEQIVAWKSVTTKVHEKGAKIFSQLFHAGRLSHKDFQGLTPLAPSAIGFEGRIPRTDNWQYGTPKEMTIKDIETSVSDFVQAAVNAIEAGFDGVEIHGANGYLIDQFLHQESNKRTDAYGGTPEKNARFALEVLDGIVAAIGKDKVGYRLSPHAYLHMSPTEGDEKNFDYLLKEIEKRDIAYLHTGVFDDHEVVPYLGGKVSEYMRKNYKGTLIANGSYTIAEGTDLMNENKFDLLAIGRSLIANPDLVEKTKNNETLLAYHNDMLTELN